MPLFRAIYLSRGTRELDPAELQELVRAAGERNARDGITGVLCHSDPYYLQVIEGPSRAVNRLLARLFRDPRHADLTITTAGTVPARLFPDWGMQLLGPEAHDGAGPRASASGLEPSALISFLTRLAARSGDHLTTT